MTKYLFVNRSRRSTFYSRLALFIVAVACLAVRANAQDLQQSFAAAQESAPLGLIEAVVTDVQGTNLKITGGITIDISKAVIFSIEGARLNTLIKPGMCIRANIVGSDDAASTLVADSIRVHQEDRIIFSGLLQAVDLDNGHMTLMNRRILLTGETSIPIGFKQRKLRGCK